VYLDHVALATRDAQPVLDTLVGELGGTLLTGANAVGFRPIHVRMGDAAAGMTIELLEPFAVEQSDFLERFLRTRGPGVHHLTLKAPDLRAELERVLTAGFSPVNVSVDGPDWKELFLTPKEAHGTVVQLTEGGNVFASFAEQFAHAREHGPWTQPQWWSDPPPRAETPTFLHRIVVRTPALDETVAFYTDILGATVDAERAGAVDVVWGDRGRVGLELDRAAAPGVARLELTGPGPARRLTLAGTELVIEP
jgi:methylmalonyl-CoA/ethylmalonyl-CoA epimerase